MNFVDVKIEKKKFLIKTKFDSLGSKILRLLHIKPPKNLTPINELYLWNKKCSAKMRIIIFLFVDK